jgi:hypothetical protein
MFGYLFVWSFAFRRQVERREMCVERQPLSSWTCFQLEVGGNSFLRVADVKPKCMYRWCGIIAPGHGVRYLAKRVEFSDVMADLICPDFADKYRTHPPTHSRKKEFDFPHMSCGTTLQYTKISLHASLLVIYHSHRTVLLKLLVMTFPKQQCRSKLVPRHSHVCSLVCPFGIILCIIGHPLICR